MILQNFIVLCILFSNLFLLYKKNKEWACGKLKNFMPIFILLTGLDNYTTFILKNKGILY